ncbi:recombinase XerD [Nocardia sp. NPDC049707]|uniref:recombinase XerD n=1 Tax=Nocardia sp. NPDC049707 TaxID=3154735 RepID=UPI00343441A1
MDSGAAVSVVAKSLGHNPAVLPRVYGHAYPEALEAAGAAVFDDETEETGT